MEKHQRLAMIWLWAEEQW